MTDDPMRMIIVGAGGTGGWLAMGLARMLEIRAPGSMLVLVDGDAFEPKNMDRQHYLMHGNKAEVRAAELAEHFPHTIIAPRPFYVVADDAKDSDDTIKVSELIAEHDVVYCTVDNHAARKVIFDHAATLDNVDVFTGGNDDRFFGSTLHYQRRDGVNVIEHPAECHDEFVNPPDRNPGELSCQERAELEGGTQVLAMNMMVASVLLARTQLAIFERASDAVAEIFFDLEQGMARGEDRREPAPVTATSS